MIVEETKQAKLRIHNGYGDKYNKCQVEGCELDNLKIYSLPMCDIHWNDHMRGKIIGAWKD